jgi:hypothetical protein
MSEKVISLYDSMLTSLGFEITTDGFIKSVIGDDKTQMVADGKPMVMPTFSNLRNPTNKTIFHPLREDMVGGESKIIESLRKAIAVRVNVIFTSIALDLMNVAASPTLQKGLSAEQSDLITGLGEVDESTVKKLAHLCAAMAKKDPFRSFISMYGRRGGVVDGKKYKRVCIVTFPFYEELLKDEERVFGTKVSVKQRDAMLRMLRFIFPGIEDDDIYSSGSNSKVAPFFDSLIQSTMKLYSTINDLLDNYGSRIDGADRYRGDFSWYQDFEEIDNMTKDILSIPAHGGPVQEQPEEPLQQAHPVPVQPQVQAATYQQPTPMIQPVQQPQPVPGRSSLGELLSRNPTTAAAAMGGMPGMGYPGGYQGMQMAPIRSAPSWSVPGTPMSPASGMVDPWGRPVPMSSMPSMPMVPPRNDPPWY